MKSTLSIVNKHTLGVFSIIGIVTIFIIHFIFILSPLFTIGALFFLFIIILFLHNPVYGFILIIISRTSVDFLSSRFSIYITDAINLNLASLFAILSVFLYTIFLLNNRKNVLSVPLIIPFILFILLTITSYLWSVSTITTIQETLRITSIFFTYLVAYIICIKDIASRKTILTSILFASIIPISFALFQLITQTGMTDATGLDGRLFGTFAEANGFASFMLVIISILLYNTFSQKNSIQDNKPQLTLLGLSILLLLLTFSRGGWLALIVLLGVFGLIKKPKALIAFTLLFIVLFFTSSKIHDRIEDVYNPPADSSIRWRIRQWNDVIETWKLSPIYGHGGGTEIIIHEQEHSYLSGDPYTHNDLLKVMQETGLIGLALFVFLLATTLILLFKKYLKLTNKNDKLFVLITLLLFLAQLSFGMSSNIWRGTAVEWIIWTLVACALSISTSKDSQIDRV